MRRPVIAGNWKMYKIIDEAVAFVRDLRPLVAQVDHCEVVVAPPLTTLRAVADAARGSNIAVAAQNVDWEAEGAHTGDVCTRMIVDAGASHVIIGHSERRHDHGETDQDVNRKLKISLAAALVPIVCVGETLQEREAGRTAEVLERQFSRGLVGLTAPEFSRIMLAYEPVWAIGTGRTATPEMAGESHRQLRSLAAERFGDVAADQVRILYGGSVKPENIRGLMAQREIDGALVGGASLKLESFNALVHYV
ncbi:MAG TPA: triose-phosphate isomerase [Terriglobia bacterium]